MQILPVKTRTLTPPQDDLFAVFDESLPDVHEGDVVVVSSKVVAIHEGHVVAADGVDKSTLVAAEADIVIPRHYWYSPLTVVKSAFIGTAGIDESNANGYLVKLPSDPFASAQKIQAYLKERFSISQVGVVITDSHSTPLRRGAIGVAIGWWGFAPTINHVGETDLFGREIQVEVTNLADGLAAAANVVMGEVDECQPIAIIKDAPSLSFVDGNTKDELFVAPEADTFRVLYEAWLPKIDS